MEDVQNCLNKKGGGGNGGMFDSINDDNLRGVAAGEGDIGINKCGNLYSTISIGFMKVVVKLICSDICFY